MRIPLVIPLFKRFALYEKGMNNQSCKSIIQTVQKFEKHSNISTLKQIKTDDIRNYLYGMRESRGWTAKTFRNQRQSLFTFFSFCKKREYISKNPVANIEKPKLPKSLPRCLAKKDVYLMLDNLGEYEWNTEIERKRNVCIIRTFLYSGIRLSELINLRNEDVNLEENTLRVNGGKGNKDRIIPIHKSLKAYLKSYKRLKHKKISGSVYFFTSIRSTSRLTTKNIYAIFYKLRKASGVYFTPHMLRHTFAKLSIQSNLNIFKLKQIMGHSSVSTTQIYVSVSLENIKSSFETLDFL